MATLANDNFTRANQSGFGTASDGTNTWGSPVNGSGTASISSNRGIFGNFNNDTQMICGSHSSTTDINMLVKLSTSNTNNVAGILWRYSSASGGNGYRCGFFSGNQFVVDKYTNGSRSNLVDNSITSYSANSDLWIRLIHTAGGTLQIRWWADGNSEPSNFNSPFVNQSETAFSSGDFGVSVAIFSGNTVSYGSFTVTDNQSATQVVKDLSTRFRLRSANQLKDLATRFRLRSANQLKDVTTRFRLRSANQLKDIAARFRLRSPDQKKDLVARFRLRSAAQLKDLSTRLRLRSANQLKDLSSRFRLRSASQLKDLTARFRLRSANQLKDLSTRLRIRSANQMRDLSARLRLRSANVLKDLSCRLVLSVGHASTKDLACRFWLKSSAPPLNGTLIVPSGQGFLLIPSGQDSLIVPSGQGTLIVRP